MVDGGFLVPANTSTGMADGTGKTKPELIGAPIN